MTIDDWLSWAVADAERRRLPELKPLLESLAEALRALRGAVLEHAEVKVIDEQAGDQRR